MRNRQYYKEVILTMLAVGRLPANPRQIERMTTYLMDWERHHAVESDDDGFEFGFTINEELKDEE